MIALTSASTMVQRLRSFVSTQTGGRRSALAFVVGSGSVLAFAPVFASPVLFLTLPIFVWLIDSSGSPRRAAIDGWWFGFGYFFFNLFWIGEAFLVEADKFAWLLPFAVTLLPAGLALFWALAAGAAQLFWPRGFARVLTFALVLSFAEYLRGHLFTGLPWNVPGYALTAPLELMQSAGLFGIYGLTLLALIIFAGPLVHFGDEGSGNRLLHAAAIAVVPLAVMFGYGALKLNEPQAFVDGVKFRIVQPSVLQTEKWRPEFQRRIFDDHLTLSVTNPQGVRDDLRGITHVVWPEAAMPFFPLETEIALSAIADMLPDGRVLVTGALRRELQSASADQLPTLGAAKVFNSILVLDDAGHLNATYDKIHLVPFGEYLPAEPLLGAVGLKKLTHGRGAFTPGMQPKPLLSIAGLPPVAGMICYEALFPEEAMPGGDKRAGLILNVTNDGWFGNSTGPRQHFYQTRVRAVEQGVPVLRAANNGISAMIDAYGRVLGALWMNERGVIDSALPQPAPLPLYARVGDLLFVGLMVATAAFAYGLDRKSGR